MARKTDESTICRLLDVAERLYGQLGFGAVSLTQIRIAARSGNKNVIPYHFGDANGLVRAILDKRLPELEAQQYSLLSSLSEDQRFDVRALTTVLYRPLLNHRDEAGDRTHARFTLALLVSGDVERLGEVFVRLQSTAGWIVSRLSEITGIPLPIILERERLIAIMVLTSVFNRLTPFDQPSSDEALIDHVLDVASAAVATPVNRSMLSLVHPDL
ncbi:hypothetical protein KRR38_08765 [Novosphingobium sp. G106]|uniref:TetR/AcrR family transcriptional regulator n=1 Tax=Novosphingobium sp. G106 TaxID=2849500 RepID=UPI001C2D4A52|nr:TetR/AcrR family transcriptional regulator [Novosphingobium sp. G106]MBV1687764.1 hypothetical protein [Novosphingobium sp. G106]